MSDAPTATGLHLHDVLASGQVLAGRFRVERLLGMGGMGMVYLANDLTLEVPVAIKVLRPELAERPQVFERFRQELLLARQVSSPHVVRIHDLAEHQGRWLISMDYVAGESLESLLAREGPLPIERALSIARQIALGLQAAHARAVVHRDLKPANVLLDAEGNASINDFGVARSMASSGLTRHSGAIVGTPDYLSPEQARGETVDPRSDLYALGLILHEMLTGQLPFANGTMAEVLAQRMLRTPEPVSRARPETPPWVVRLVDRLLRSQPRARLQDAAQVVAAIDRRHVEREAPGWRRIALVAAAVVVVVLIGWAGWSWKQARAPAVAEAPVVAPLARTLVLPLAGDLDPVLREGLGAWLRDALEARTAVVDAGRTLQALRSVDPTGQARPDLPALRRAAAARQVLAPRMRHDAQGWRLSATLDGADGGTRTLEGPIAGTASAAAAGWLTTVGAALGLAPSPWPAPPPDAALQALGRAGIARAQSQGAPRLAALTQATDAAPDVLPLRLEQVRAAEAIGEDDQADALLARPFDSKTWPRSAQMLSAMRASAEGDAEAALTAWQAIADARPDDAQAQLDLARAQAAAGQGDAARARLLALSKRDPNDPRVWFELGKQSILAGDAAKAVDDYLLRAQLLFRRGRDLAGEAETVNALGVGYGRLGQSKAAEEQYTRAVDLRTQVGNRRGVATSLRNLSGIASVRGDFAGAAARLEQARALYQALGDRGGLAATHNEAGLLAEERGDYAQALQAFRDALQAWQQVGNARGTAQTYNNIGFANFQLGDYDSAAAFWQQAASAYRALDDVTGQVRIEQNLGLLATARGQWQDAATRLQSALRTAEAHQMFEEVAVTRRNLAELAYWQGHLAEGLAQADQAATLFEQRDDQRGRADVAVLRAQLWLAAGQPARATAELEQDAKLFDEVSEEQQAARALLQAQLASLRGDARGAHQALAEATRLADASGVRLLQLQARLQGAHDEAALAALDDDIARLGHVGLRLQFLLSALREGADAQVQARYREAQQLLRRGDVLFAADLHAQAAQRLARLGQTDAAARAEAAADAARRTLLAGLPAQAGAR
ncbi:MULTISPECIES: serine/threonine-protein kinase [Pseudoxanthomonas]|uniref:non-specific serine/threonine protein kinase n=1 Tax=Pseudoxanthomonas winnipegensis TaxID=2480810 RepID=A0AAW8G8G0_9GAMM|nr:MULTISPECIES: serine/threonine-protein kinase [Pseudoxanthomonas]MDQ1118430.1 tetratricopeptide (TPR) repeat protein [Pseudoxanthomonas winnipegensis]MDQ1131614.1 tetratricopeptide (TPR) repeat protein [Pseudoxanthomonas winnipegensis]MDR6138370.1 tetratricopeptide (TPR) repeat protein [Pseudoxanthomonas sp. SORGH_AS_0997]